MLAIFEFWHFWDLIDLLNLPQIVCNISNLWKCNFGVSCLCHIFYLPLIVIFIIWFFTIAVFCFTVFVFNWLLLFNYTMICQSIFSAYLPIDFKHLSSSSKTGAISICSGIFLAVLTWCCASMYSPAPLVLLIS